MLCQGASVATTLCPGMATSPGPPRRAWFQFTVKEVSLSVRQPSGTLQGAAAPSQPLAPSQHRRGGHSSFKTK